MQAIDSLRNIANQAMDNHTRFCIEMWIQKHVVEIKNSFVITDEYEKHQKNAIQECNKKLIASVCQSIVENGSMLAEVPVLSDITIKNDMKLPHRKFERRIFIIKESE